MLLNRHVDADVNVISHEAHAKQHQPMWILGKLLMIPKIFRSHKMTTMITTTFKIDFMDPAMGMKRLMTQRAIPTTISTTTTSINGIDFIHLRSAISANLLNPAKQHQNKENQQDQAKSSARHITPLATMGPGRNCPEKQQYYDDDQNCSQHCHAPLSSVYQLYPNTTIMPEMPCKIVPAKAPFQRGKSAGWQKTPELVQCLARSAFPASANQQHQAANQCNNTHNRRQRNRVGLFRRHLQGSEIDNFLSARVADALIPKSRDCNNNQDDAYQRLWFHFFFSLPIV
jgi:hypothetical protein